MSQQPDYRAIYESPADVLADRLLTYADKHRILEDWRLDAVRRIDSASEGMDGGRTPRLEEIDRALGILESVSRLGGHG